MNALLGLVVLTMVVAMLVSLAASRRAPRLAAAASVVMGMGLGVCFLWLAASAIMAGYIEGDELSKLFKGRLDRARSPVLYWWWVAFFGVPGVVLIGSGLLACLDGLRSTLDRVGTPRAGRGHRGKNGEVVEAAPAKQVVWKQKGIPAMPTIADHDAYIAAAAEPLRPSLKRLRALLARALPEAEEVVAYNMPGFCIGGSVVAGYAAFSKQCGLYLAPGAIAEHADAIAAAGLKATKTGVTFSPGKPIPDDLVERLARASRKHAGA